MALMTGLASAHDTWFEAKTQKRSGRIVMALGTGNHFPVLEYPLALAALHSSGCRQGAQPMALKGMTATPKFTLMQTEAKAQSGISGTAEAISCWAQSVPFDIEIPADKVSLYFDEINPPQATRDRWAALQARGLPWLERYVKHARIELSNQVLPAESTPAQPA
ncbi:hypothetical protein ACVBEH_19815, partial [Roseateles sp. GG27B]